MDMGVDMSAGRPTLYNEDIIRQTKDYLRNRRDDIYLPADGKPQVISANIPTIEELAYELDISRSTLYLWIKEHPAFSDIIEKLQQKQASMLIKAGLAGQYNSTIAKVLLTKHGYTDRQEVEQKTTIKDERIDPSKLTPEQRRNLADIQLQLGSNGGTEQP
jgi:transposase-like protein